MNLHLSPSSRLVAPLLVAIALLSTSLVAQAQVILNFNSAGQFTGNFRKLTATTNNINDTTPTITADLAGSSTAFAVHQLSFCLNLYSVANGVELW